MQLLCDQTDLIPNAGVCALYDGEQIALFYLPESDKKLYAINNFDPFGKANVLSRGIVGSLKEKTVVASPLLKQHFDLQSGMCIEDEHTFVKTYPVKLVDNKVYLDIQPEK